MVLRKIFAKLLFICALFVAVTSLVSCTEEETEVSYCLFCSDDVLEYVNPIVSYLDENGCVQEVALTKDDFENRGNGSVSVEGRRTKYWRVGFVKKGADFSTYCSVSFVKIKDLPNDEDTFEYLAEIVPSVQYKKESISSNSIQQNVEITVNQFVLNPQNKNKFEKSLSDLIKNGLKVDLTIDKNGNIVKN